MMITVAQFGRKYSKAEVEIMNAAVREAVFYFDVETLELSDSERQEIIDEIETNVVASFFNGKVLYATPELLPEKFQRFLAARAR
jgi:hypothetical protein